MRTRILAVVSVLLVMAMVLPACGGTPKVEIGTDANPLTMVFVPSGDTQKILAGGQDLDKLIKEKTGLVTKSSVATSFAAVVEAMGTNKADIGWLNPLNYVLGHDKYAVELLLLTMRSGKATYKGQIMVRTDSNINSVADLKGKKFAFVDPVSTSGYLYPVGLMKKNGVDADKDLTEKVFAGSHPSAVLAVYKGQVDASASYDDARSTIEKDFPDVKSKVKILTYTDEIPNDTISVRKDLPQDIKDKLKKGLLEIAGTDAGKTALQTIYEINGLADGKDALYDPVRQAATALGIDLKNWKGVSVNYQVGFVTDLGGIDDKSFNQTAWKGVQDAMKKFPVDGKYIQSTQQTDYAKNITEFVQQKYDMIVTVGYLLGVDTAKSAKDNPNTKFVIVDYTYPDCYPGAVVGKDCGSEAAIPNVLGLGYATDQAAFLAGYLSAGLTKTGKVGTFGGIKLPTVTIFMKGFQAGVLAYNAKHNTKVQVLGWDSAKDDGLFVGNFTSKDDGRKTATSLADEGCDILLPVAGQVGLGAAAVAVERKLMLIGVDTDQYVTAPEFKAVWLTSVLKNMDTSVYDAINSMRLGTFKGGVNYTGTLANKGVGLASFHDFDAQVPQALKDEITALTADIVAGKVTTGVK